MRALVRIVVTLTVPIALLLMNVWLLASGPFVGWEYARPGFPAAAGMTDEERLELSLPSARFVVDSSDPQTLADLRRDGEPLYTDAEISHLLDVRRLIQRATALALVGLAVTAVAAMVWWRDPGKRRKWLRSLERGGWLTAGLVVLVGSAIVLAWPLFFVGFHELLFPPGTWSFEPDSGLITLYPERFWFDVALAIAALTAVEGVVVAGVARLTRNRMTA